MIDQFIVEKLQRVTELRKQVWPVGAPLADAVPPFCVYTLGEEQITRDLCGEPLLYTMEVRIDLLGDDYDRLQELTPDVEKALAVINAEHGEIYIYSSSVTRHGEDGWVEQLDMMAKTLYCTIVYWRE